MMKENNLEALVCEYNDIEQEINELKNEPVVDTDRIKVLKAVLDDISCDIKFLRFDYRNVASEENL